MRNKPALFVFAVCMAAGAAFAETGENGKQSSAGDKSPVINAGGNVLVNYGMDEKRFEAMLKRQQDILLKELKSSDASGSSKLEKKLKAVEEKLADLQTSYKEELKQRKAADEALEQLKMQSQLSDVQAGKAQTDLKQGNLETAEQTLESISNPIAAYQSGQLAEGRLDYEKALRQYKKAVELESNNPDYLFAAGKMARMLAEYKQAQDWLERLLKIREAEKNKDRNLGEAYNVLALLYQDQGKYKEAATLHQNALAIFEATLGSEHPDVATSLSNLAGLYCQQGRYAEAEQLYSRALTIKEKALGAEHPLVARIQSDLGSLYQEQGRYAEAEPLLQRALVVCEKSLGAEHPDIVEVLNNLTGLYLEQSRLGEAEPFLQRTLNICEKTLGKEHPAVATALSNMATLSQDKGHGEEAERLYHKALAIYEKTLGSEHLFVAKTLSALSLFYLEQKKYWEAKPLLDRSAEIVKKMFGSEHPYMAEILIITSLLDIYQEKYDKALSGIQQSLVLCDKFYKKDSVCVGMNFFALCVLYTKIQKYNDAKEACVRSFIILNAKFPNGHPNINILKNIYIKIENELSRLRNIQKFQENQQEFREKILKTQ